MAKLIFLHEKLNLFFWKSFSFKKIGLEVKTFQKVACFFLVDFVPQENNLLEPNSNDNIFW